MSAADEAMEKVPKVLQRVTPGEVSMLRSASDVLVTRGEPVPTSIATERRAKETHVDAVRAFQERMRFGSAAPHHAEAVLDWLIAQGWKAPPHVFLTVEGSQP